MIQGNKNHGSGPRKGWRLKDSAKRFAGGHRALFRAGIEEISLLQIGETGRDKRPLVKPVKIIGILEILRLEFG